MQRSVEARHLNGGAALPAPPLPRALDASALLQTPAPAREWLVEGWIPAHDVTLLGADGGTGKTLLALLLAYACATGWTWLGLTVRQCRALYYGAEEPEAELHWRLEQIARHILAGPIPAGALQLVSVADQDAELAAVGKAGTLEPTPRLLELENYIVEHRIGLLILDASADVYGADEVDRRHVRAFIRLLRGVAIRQHCTILLLAHPSVDGMRSGRGYSGSTHWSNAVRSRLYMTVPTAGDDDTPADPDLRELTVMKANRAARGQRLMLRWREHVFQTVDGASAADSMASADARRVFLDLLGVLTRLGERVTTKSGTSYAPARMAEQPEGRRIGKKALARAMRELQRDGQIVLRTTGPETRQRTHLEAA